MDRSKEQQRIGRIFFGIFLLICLLNVFYIPDQYTDRFFTSGMIWLGITIPLFFCLFVLFISGLFRLPAMWLYITGLLIVSGVYAWKVGTFSGQQMSFRFALCLLLLILSNSGAYLKLGYAYFLLSAIAVLESVLGIAQYFRWYEVYSSGFRVTGTFDNPAGFAAYLAVSFPFVLFFLFGHSFRERLWGWIVSVVLLIAIILSGSRTGIIASVIVIVSVIFRYWPIGRQKTLRIFLPAGIVMFFLFLSVLYLLKKDSADGRLLIWRCTLEMIRDKPLLGHGPETFGGQYMVYQARSLVRNQDKRSDWLAGNVKHPFNEYLKITSEYGIAGLAAIVLLGGWLFQIFRRSGRSLCFLFFSLLAAAVCGLFSYPLNYPSVCFLLVVVLGLIGRESRGISIGRKWIGVMGLLCCIGLVIFTIVWKNAEVYWYRISRQALAGNTEKVLDDYARLCPFMSDNALFLYNYGAELNHAGYWQKSVVILQTGLPQLNDTDVQMLLADNYINLKAYDQAEECLILASQMCPVRFLPLYRLMKLYDDTGRNKAACRLAKKYWPKK